MFGAQTTSRSERDDKRKRPMTGPQVRAPGKVLRRALFLLLVMATTVTGGYLMLEILLPNGLTVLEMALLGLFVVTFAWIVHAFWNAVLGFILQLLRRDPLTLKPLPAVAPGNTPIDSRTAVIMPVYNEDAHRVICGFEANLRSLQHTGQLTHFDFFLLSDSQQPEAIAAEEKAWKGLLHRLGPLASHVTYRRREQNTKRKVGNIEDFCERWGDQYEHMVVLDADSIMTGQCIMSLVRTMEANPRLALLQTVPMPVRQQTLFGRFLQFAATLYSPMLATGMAFWQTDTANYWGHNAIIRIAPFREHARLPRLRRKRGPFSGDILSHDFVEAALLRQAGWDVALRADFKGSYEELPSNILDYATRDRRWAEGNIQHLALLGKPGFHFINRLHMLFGAIAYLSSLVWMLMLALSSVDAVMRSVNSNRFFTQQYQLFPDWPIAKTEQIVSLFVLTAALLLMPKVPGAILGLIQQPRAYGGRAALLCSVLLEALFAILIAPLMMVYHTYFIFSIFVGRKVNWNAQAREGRLVPWGEAIKRTWQPTWLALLWGGAMYYYSPLFFWWLTPVLLGMVLAAPIVRTTSSLALGQGLRNLGLLQIPEERNPPPVLRLLEQRLPQPGLEVTLETQLPAGQLLCLRQASTSAQNSEKSLTTTSGL